MENTSSDKGSQGKLPNKGRFIAKRWAEILDIEVKTLMDNISKFKIRVVRFGRIIFIDAAWFWEDLVANQTDGEEM